jgi:hypothetical protein
MSFANPTPLRIGQAGTLEGRRYTVAGRIVLGMEEGGETYYWNEFNLVDASGRGATLVFEETEDGPEWKLFTLFEPFRPLTPSEAAAKRVGDTVNLDGTPTPVTLVDQSRVCHIEGTPPEGVEVGDVADYFNAEAGPRMLVASWSDEDIEFYRGRDLTANVVAGAFGLPLETGRSGFFSGSGIDAGGLAVWVTKLVPMILLGVVIFSGRSCWIGRHATSAAPAKQVAPAATYAPGVRGQLAGQEYTITGHALVEVARVGAKFDRHEYALTAKETDGALLIQGLGGDPKVWHLLRPVAPAPRVTPEAAAALRRGSPANFGGRTLPVVDLFLSKTIRADGPPPAAGPAGTVQYGFVARAANDWLMARWTASGVQCFVGPAVPDKAVREGFGPPANPAP